MNETERTEAKDGDGTKQAQEPSPQSGEPTSPRKEAKRKAKAPIGSVAHLIRTNYELKAGVRKLQRADLGAILAGPALEEAERVQVLELARTDATLQQTKQLLLLSTRTEAPKLVNGLREFGREVLTSHPMFQGNAMQGVLANPQSMSMDRAVATLASADVKMLNEDGDKPLPKSQVERIRTNAFHCLLLLLRASQGTSLLRIQRTLQKYVWAPKTRRHRTENQKLEVLVASRDPTAASVTFALLDDEAVMQGQKAEAATRSEQRAQTRAQGLEQRLAELEGRLGETEGQCAELRERLDEAEQAHAARDARWRDNFERLKGRALNRLIVESSLLEEGLHALKREPPKVRVMIDHAERAIEGLKGEAAQIRRSTTA